MSKQKTIEDIIREMRFDFICPNDGAGCEGLLRIHREWADRIEEAWKRSCDNCPVKAAAEEMAESIMVRKVVGRMRNE